MLGPMVLSDDFIAAKERVQGLPKRPSDRELLELYGLYKQATEGDVRGKRPGMLDVRGRKKYDAWARRKGMASEDAQLAYVAVVERLASGR